MSLNKSDPHYIKGRDAVKRYYDAMKSHHASKVNFTFDDMIQILESRVGQKSFLIGLGVGIDAVEFSNSKVQSAMNNLAKASGGKLPANNSAFFQSIQGVATSFSFVDAVSFTVKESAKDIVNGTTKLGDTLIMGLSIANFLLIPVALLVGYWFLLSVKKTKFKL